MIRILPRSSLFAPFLVTLLAPAVRADFLVVGLGPGDEFSDIPSAIAAAVPGDVLLVQPYAYSGGFVLDKGLTIIGYGSAQISGDVLVTNLPANQRATIVHLSLGGLVVDQCDGPVILQELTCAGALDVSTCADVRLLQVTTIPPPVPTLDGVEISDARVEIVRSSLSGSDASSSFDFGSAAGGAGLSCLPGSRVHFARSVATGGGGQVNSAPRVSAGDGAPGIRSSPTAELILAGGGQGAVFAGFPGINFFYSDCCFDGGGAAGLEESAGSETWYSGADIQGSISNNNCAVCSYFQHFPICCSGSDTEVTPDDPTLDVAGSLGQGQTLTLTVHGPAGASAMLLFGRDVTVVPDAETHVERLVTANLTIDLGVIPASGQKSHTLGLPSLLPPARFHGFLPGTFFAAQAEIVLPSQRIRRTNSIPIVVR